MDLWLDVSASDYRYLRQPPGTKLLSGKTLERQLMSEHQTTKVP